MTLLRRALVAFYLFMWIGGLVAYLFLGGPPPHVAWTAPLFLLLAGLLVLATAPPRLAALLAAVSLVGFGSEVSGVHIGFPFGAYRYTDVLGPSLWGVPVVLTAAWMVLLAYTREIIARLEARRAAGDGEVARGTWWGVLLGAAWMTAIDLVIDPLAAGPLDYWRWEASGIYFGIPATNFAGWLLVSALALALLKNRWQPHPAARRIGASVVFFFAALAAGLGYPGPALLGLGLVGLDLWLSRPGA